MTPVEILKAARELIAKPERWTRGVLARNAAGEQTDSRDPGAVCWCAIGAVARAAPVAELTNEERDAWRLLHCQIRHSNQNGTIPAFNDSHDHAEVLELFDRAIASAQS